MKKFIISTIVLLGILFGSYVLAVGTLRESFDTGDDTAENIRGANWASQTFLTTSAYTLNELHIYAKRTGSPGTCTVALRATSGGLPTGANLASGTFDGNAISTTDAWITVTQSAYDVSNSTTYAIVLSCPSGSVGNQVSWRMDSANGYANGSYISSSNSGSSWTADTTYDFMFRVYGTDIAGGGGSTTTTTTTDALIDYETRNVYNGFILFFISFFGILFYFKKGGVNK